MELPLAYINEMKALLGEEYEAYLASLRKSDSTACGQTL